MQRDPQAEQGFSPAEALAVLRRRIWWFAIPATLGVVIGGLVAFLWPAEYEAGSIVLIEPQGVPQELVATTVTADTEARFGQIRLQLLTRDSLSPIITEFKLYEGEPFMEQRVEAMRDHLNIAPLPPAIVDPRRPVTIESFRIAYRHSSPETAAAVANQLTNKFVNANLRERARAAEGTREFIDSELNKADAERARLSQELMQYRDEHQGQLPSDLQFNQMRLDRLAQNERELRAALELAKRQSAEIRREIREVRIAGSDKTADPASRHRGLELQLNRFRSEGKTDKHPDVVIVKTELEQLERLMGDQINSDAPLSPAESSLRGELRNHEVRMKVISGQLDRVLERIAETEEAIAATPLRTAALSQLEQQLTGLNERITTLQNKKIAADLGQSVELGQKGERFRIAESAEAPTSPISPNRPLVLLVFVALGLAAGTALFATRELMDQSFHSTQDVSSALDLPVLGSISNIRLASEVARARRWLRRGIVTGIAVIAVLAGGGLAFYVYSQIADELPRAERKEAKTGV